MSHHRRYTDSAIIEAVQSSRSIRQVLAKLNLSPTGANYIAIQQHFRRLQLDTAHLLGQGWLKGGTSSPWSPPKPLETILVEHSTCHATSRLKRRLIREGLLVNCCAICGSPPSWQGQPLVLILDHINGNRSDNRIENLRLLCPNCNSQQPTFAGRNKGRCNFINGAPNPSSFANIATSEPDLFSSLRPPAEASSRRE
jgi:hypothetical protein